MRVILRVNENDHELEVEAGETLNFILRERLGLTGTKRGCDSGGCGACTVIMNGEAVYSCMTYVAKLDGASITTIEGLGKNGEQDRVQRAFVENYSLQCGYCTPGFILSTKALLDKNQGPTVQEVKQALVGNLCRCTGYTKIIEAVIELTKDGGRSSSEMSQ